jgi:N4-gp56 family major capsid protein
MAQQTWIFDAPSGVYKSHAISTRLYTAAVEDAKFMAHVDPQPDIGRKKGETITLSRVKAMTEPLSPDLTEGERIPEDTITLNTTSITMVEVGRAVPYTSLADDFSEYNIANTVQKELRRQMTLALDTKASAAFRGCQVKYVPTGLASNSITTNGTAGASATANLNVFHVEEIADYMSDTLFVPTIGDGYVGIFRTLGLRGIKRDPAWEEWHKYTNPQAKFTGEVGMIENIRFIQTNHNNALGKVGTGSVLGSGVVFGEDAVVMAEARTPELLARPDAADFGRSRAVAWYGILEFGEVWDTGNSGEARIMHITST